MLGLGVGVRVESYHGVVRVDFAAVPSTEQAAAYVDKSGQLKYLPVGRGWPRLDATLRSVLEGELAEASGRLFSHGPPPEPTTAQLR